jgi:hypothetical protein
MTKPSPHAIKTQRLAAAFLLHRHRDDIAGMNVILAEIEDGETATRLLLGVANLADFLLTEMCGDNAEQSLQNVITGLAAAEGNQP